MLGDWHGVVVLAFRCVAASVKVFRCLTCPLSGEVAIADVLLSWDRRCPRHVTHAISNYSGIGRLGTLTVLKLALLYVEPLL